MTSSGATILEIFEEYSALADADVARIWYDVNPTGRSSQPLIEESRSSERSLSGVLGAVDFHIFVAETGLDTKPLGESDQENRFREVEGAEGLDWAVAGLDADTGLLTECLDGDRDGACFAFA